MSARELELVIDDLAAGGDGVGRDADGRVTFVPRTAPGDRVRVAVERSTSSYARGTLRAVLAAGAARRASACPAFEAGCGGCQWLHVDDDAQRAAKHALVVRALRRVPGLQVRPLAAPAPPLRWRRRARLHVRGGRLGFYERAGHRVVAIASCPQLDPRLEALLPVLASAGLPDGELAIAVAHDGAIAISHDARWPGAAALVGVAGVVGVTTAQGEHGAPVLELEPGLWGRAEDFAQASADANRELLATVARALGPGQGRALLELYAGAGNFSRVLGAAGWRVTACDVVAPARPMPGVTRLVADAAVAVASARAEGAAPAAILLDPPRAGAREILDAMAALGAAQIVYVSCDPATLARDVERLVALGYRALWAQPIDAMPQTAHIETVVALTRGSF